MTLPNRPGLTEASFRRYEKAIEAACRNFPQTVEIETKPGESSMTVTARLRDAILSLKRFNWPITWSKTNLENLVVTHQDGKIRIGDSYKAAPTQAAFNPVVKEGILELSAKDLEAFCQLITSGHLSGPILFYMPEDAETPSFYELAFNVSITDELNHHILT